MGEIADMMIKGIMCAECGVYLEPDETVFIQDNRKKTKMPKEGGFGIPVVCACCK